MNDWGLSNVGISDDPHDGLNDLLAQMDEDVDSLVDIMGDFFDECPEAWKQFCVFWVKYCQEEMEEGL